MIGLGSTKKKKEIQQVQVPDYNPIKDDPSPNLAKLMLFGLGLCVAIWVLFDND